jgi:Ser/Thr protein kinase RdoA (MazF antagonist)
LSDAAAVTDRAPPALPDDQALPLALARFPGLAAAAVRPLDGGLINRTFLVEPSSGGPRYVLQRVNPIFDPVIHHNIRAVTARLAAAGLCTPTLVDTIDGASWADLGAGGVWRLLTFVPGHSYPTVGSPAQARQAGALVARFHRALEGLDHRFEGLRGGVHDTARHLTVLAEAVGERSGHRLWPQVFRLADGIEAAAAVLAPLPGLPSIIAHGDLKFSNLVFAEDGGARALVDLDTVGPLALAYELGDAWRSWCNPLGEEREDARFDLEVFGASLAGYTAALGRPLGDEERRALLGGVEWVSLELAARFAADALREQYFGWDPRRFAGRGEHNLARARSQMALHHRVMACRADRQRALGLA